MPFQPYLCILECYRDDERSCFLLPLEPLMLHNQSAMCDNIAIQASSFIPGMRLLSIVTDVLASCQVIFCNHGPYEIDTCFNLCTFIYYEFSMRLKQDIVSIVVLTTKSLNLTLTLTLTLTSPLTLTLTLTLT